MIMQPKKAIITLLVISPMFYSSPISGQYSQEMGREPAYQSVFSEQVPQENAWLSFQSRYFTVYFEPGVDLKKVQKRLSRRMFYNNAIRRQDPLAGPEEKVALRIDAILERVKEILDMYPLRMNLKIRIFKDRQSLDDEFYRIFSRSQDIKSFYVHKYETIYISEASLTDSIIAHEMGHAVVDHYFAVIPPEKVGEMLASYVDLHLED